MRVFIWVLIALAFLVNLVGLKDGHNWGDDFAQYIISANNIMEGRPYASGIMLDKPEVLPPGLSLLLVPELKVFGLNFKVLKLWNIFSWYLSIVFLYLLFLRIKGTRFALWSAVFLAVSSFFFVFKQNVLSDIPFFLCVCSSLYTLERWENNTSILQGRLFFTGYLFSMVAATWLRSAGVILFVAALFYFIFIKRDKKASVAVLTVFIVNEFLLFCWMGWHPGNFADIWQMPRTVLNDLIHNFPTVFQSLWYFLCPAQTVFSRALFNMVDPLVCLAAPVLYLIVIWSFIRGLQKQSLSYLECFSFIYLSLSIFWSWIFTPPENFARYVLPLLPFVFWGFWRLLDFLKRFKLDFYALARVIFLVLLLINFTNIAINRNFNDDVFSLPENSELVNWIKQNMKPGEHFMFWKPRALALFTQREGTAPWISLGQEGYFIQRVKAFKISYVFSFKDDDYTGLTARLDKSEEFRLVWVNGAFKIFKFIN